MGLISILLLVPALSAFMLGTIPFSARISKAIALTASLVVLALTLVAFSKFNATSADFQFVERRAWIPEFGINYEVGLDGISLFLVLLTAIAGVVVVVSSSFETKIREFLALFLTLELSLLGVFVTLDLILFYVFFELMLVPTYILMNGFGGNGRSKAAVKFVLFTALGSVLMLSSIIYLGWLNADQAGDPSFSVIELSQSLRIVEPDLEFLLFLGFLVAFAIKTPIVPFHNWLPSTYGEAPYGLTAFMSAVMAKAGLYGFLRFAWPLFPKAFFSISYIAVSVLVIGVIYTALIAWSQRDAKRLLAYSSVSHLGICALGILVCSSLSVTAAVFFMLVHGVAALGLFLCLGALVRRSGSSEIVELGGAASRFPRLTFIFFIFLLGSVALPLTGNFVAEFSVLIAVFEKFPIHSSVAGLSIILGAVYMLAMFRRIFFGKNERLTSGSDLSISELLVLGPLAALVVVFGVMPQPILSRIEPAAQRLESLVLRSISSSQDSEPPSREEFTASEDFTGHLVNGSQVPPVESKEKI